MDTKNKGEKFNNPIVIILFLALIGIGGYFLVNNEKNSNNKDQPNQNIAQNPQQDQIDILKKEIEDLKKPQAIIKEVPQKSESDLSSIISKWRPKIARIECYWYNQYGSLFIDAWGSGLLIKQENSVDKNSSYVIFTNKHVVYDKSKSYPQNCRVTFSGTTEGYIISDPHNQIGIPNDNAIDNFDFGVVFLSNPGQYIQSNALEINYKSNIQTLSYCRNKASVGDEIVILGYPGIGSQTDITATEGIISGYDGYYYITSAKVEHGNSGGAAISIKNNCYLVIPTWIETGTVESLARILDFNYVYDNL